MKKHLFLFLLCAGALFSSCKDDDHDLSVLYGKWESVGFDYRIMPQDAAVRNAVERDFLDYNTMIRLVLSESNELREYRYRRDLLMSMTSGNFFYNHGYKGNYILTDSFFGVRTLDFEIEGDRLVCRVDATRRYQDPNILETAGLTNVKDHPFDKIEIVIIYERAEFDIDDFDR